MVVTSLGKLDPEVKILSYLYSIVYRNGNLFICLPFKVVLVSRHKGKVKAVLSNNKATFTRFSLK